eukprot:CAMPEP_0178543862 /NCGR_PEP_ID=MMETSP0697-20121206/2814_1 /TAXON_ID=265572 /ORGANISM="Extubocellulus spinifer, Strain CCMP396" /LENGTH=32 /DNA_ID= /DNA_START= /DNA_END= /DNA_ORIENTATION=
MIFDDIAGINDYILGWTYRARWLHTDFAIDRD